MNILIVQRDREIQKYLKKGLKELGYTVEICSDRDDAYYHIKSDNYDLAILDIASKKYHISHPLFVKYSSHQYKFFRANTYLQQVLSFLTIIAISHYL